MSRKLIAAAVLAAGLVLAAAVPGVSWAATLTASPSTTVPATTPPYGGRQTADLRGQITENAVVVKKVGGATVTVGGTSVKATAKGRFILSGVAVGRQSLVVKAPGHAAYRSTLVVQPGENQVTVALDLTVLETYRRNFQAYSSRQYRVSYQILHPDVRAHYSYASYAAYMRKVPEIVSYSIVRTRKLASWYAEYLQKTYTNVWAITRVLRYHGSSGYFKDDPLTTHWVQAEGRWCAVFDWRLSSGRGKNGDPVATW